MQKKTYIGFLAKWAALAGILCLVLMLPMRVFADAPDPNADPLGYLQYQKTFFYNQITTFTNKYDDFTNAAAGDWTTAGRIADQAQADRYKTLLNATTQKYNAIVAALDQAGKPGADVKAIVAQAIKTNASYDASKDTGTAAIAKQKQADLEKLANSCTNLTNFTVVGCSVKVATWILSFFLMIAAFILWLAGVCFQIALTLTLSIKFLVDGNAGIAAVWNALRNLTNILFIFIMLYMSIETILDRPNNYKKLLKPVIIAAVFINFSFFIAGVVIDVSNVMAIGVYQSIVPGFQPVTDWATAFTTADTTPTDPATKAKVVTISQRFGDMLDLPKLYELNSDKSATVAAVNSAAVKIPVSGISGVNILISTLMGIVIMLVAAFVFFTATILFVVRTGTLIYLLAVAPIAFAGNVLPRLHKESEDWWSALWNQTFFAPAFLICIYLSLTILQGLGLRAIEGAGPVGLIFGDVLVIFFLLASIKVANDFGAYGAEAAVDYGGKASFGVAAWAGRKTVGNAAFAIGNNKTAKKYLGNAITSNLRDVGIKSSFDLRNVNALGGKKIVGEGDKKGYIEYQDDYLKEKDRQAGTLGLTPYQKQVLDAKKTLQVEANKKIRDSETNAKDGRVEALEKQRDKLIGDARLARDKKEEAVKPKKDELTGKEEELQKQIESQDEQIKNQREAFKAAVASGKKDAIEQEKTTLEGLVAGQTSLRTQKAAVTKEKENLTAEADKEYQKKKIEAQDAADDAIREENRKHTALMKQMDSVDAKIIDSKTIQKEAIEKYAKREETFGKALRLGDQIRDRIIKGEPTSRLGRAVVWAGNLTGDVVGSERMLAAAAKVRERNTKKTGKDKIYEAYKDLQKEEAGTTPAAPTAPAAPPAAPKPPAP